MTKTELLAALKRDAGKAMTAEQIRKQKVSYVVSTFDDPSDDTRQEVEKRLGAMEGEAA